MSARIQPVLCFQHRLRAHRYRYVEAPPHIHAKEVRRRYADHFHRFVVEHQFAAQRRAAAKLLLPEAIADHRARQPAAAAVILSGKDPPLDRPHAKQAEEISAHPQAPGETSVAARIPAEIGLPPCGNLREALVVLAQLLPDRVRHHRYPLETLPAGFIHIDNPHLRQLLRIPHRQRLQQHRVQ